MLTTSRFFAVDRELFQRVGLVRPGVGDVVGPERRRQHEEDDQDEDAEEGDRDPVAQEAAQRELPRPALGPPGP